MRLYFVVFCLVCAMPAWSSHCLSAAEPPQITGSQAPREAAGAPLQTPASSSPQEAAGPPSLESVPLLPEKSLLQPESGPNSPGGKEVLEALKEEVFVYTPNRLTDPFASFMTPAKLPPVDMSLAPAGPEEGSDEPPPEPPRPLTPLQKMSIGDIERGLKAILWGDLGRRAIIEDGTGKGYIVTVGTPVGANNGIIADIFDDHLIIQQEIWDRKARQMVPQNISIKITKKEKG